MTTIVGILCSRAGGSAERVVDGGTNPCHITREGGASDVECRPTKICNATTKISSIVREGSVIKDEYTNVAGYATTQSAR